MAEATPTTSKRWKFLWLGAAMLAVLSAAGLAYLLLAEEPSAAPPAPREEAKATAGAILPLEPFLVNLADQDSRRYLKIKVELGVDQEKSAKELGKDLPRIRDAFILLLGSKTYRDLATPEGKLRLKEEMMQLLAQVPGGRKVREIFFTEFVAQ